MPIFFAERSRGEVRDAADRAQCSAILRRGSKSFHAASWLLPARLRPPITAFYSFCRIADDAIDLAGEEGRSPGDALAALHRDLDQVYAGHPPDHAVLRSLAKMVAAHGIPRALFDALLEGFAWDVLGRRYESLEELCAYAARVAGAVGVVMTLLMGRREAATLARAAELGVAMQLTNVARDVGEDAGAGRIYLPLAWLREVGVDPQVWLRAPRFSPALGRVVARLLREAEVLYVRADLGIPDLPGDCRTAIRAARLFYADIGRSIARAGHDSVEKRHGTTALRKVALLFQAAAFANAGTDACAAAPPPLAATRFLVEAVRP